jgi:hypothetical protein
MTNISKAAALFITYLFSGTPAISTNVASSTDREALDVESDQT